MVILFWFTPINFLYLFANLHIKYILLYLHHPSNINCLCLGYLHPYSHTNLEVVTSIKISFPHIDPAMNIISYTYFLLGLLYAR